MKGGREEEEEEEEERERDALRVTSRNRCCLLCAHTRVLGHQRGLVQSSGHGTLCLPGTPLSPHLPSAPFLLLLSLSPSVFHSLVPSLSLFLFPPLSLSLSLSLSPSLSLVFSFAGTCVRSEAESCLCSGGFTCKVVSSHITPCCQWTAEDKPSLHNTSVPVLCVCVHACVCVCVCVKLKENYTQK